MQSEPTLTFQLLLRLDIAAEEKGSILPVRLVVEGLRHTLPAAFVDIQQNNLVRCMWLSDQQFFPPQDVNGGLEIASLKGFHQLIFNCFMSEGQVCTCQ